VHSGQTQRLDNEVRKLLYEDNSIILIQVDVIAVCVCRELFKDVLAHGLIARLSARPSSTISVTEIIFLCLHLLYLHGSMKERTSLMLA